MGHPSSTIMRMIIESSHENTLKGLKIPQNDKSPCEACSLRKLIIRPSPGKIKIESPTFLERIQRDICGPTHPPC